MKPERPVEAIETKRLRLRPAVAGDLEALHALFTDADVRQFLWDDEVIPSEMTADVLARSRASFEEHGFGLFVVEVLAGGDELLGFCGLRYFSAPREGEKPELLYGFYKRHWGRAYATEAARAVLRFAFEELRLPAVYAGVDPGNSASSRVLSRLGMQPWKEIELEGRPALYSVLRQADFVAGNVPYTVRWSG